MPKGQKILIVVTATIAAFVLGSALRELTRFDEAGVGAAIGLPALIALFGMFWVADNWKDALTGAFAVAYFIFIAGILAIFVFPQQSLPLEGGARVILDNFTGLFMVVIASYFGQEAVRAAAQAYSDGKVFGGKPKNGDDGGDGGGLGSRGPAQIDTNARR